MIILVTFMKKNVLIMIHIINSDDSDRYNNNQIRNQNQPPQWQQGQVRLQEEPVIDDLSTIVPTCLSILTCADEMSFNDELIFYRTNYYQHGIDFFY